MHACNTHVYTHTCMHTSFKRRLLIWGPFAEWSSAESGSGLLAREIVYPLHICKCDSTYFALGQTLCSWWTFFVVIFLLCRRVLLLLVPVNNIPAVLQGAQSGTHGSPSTPLNNPMTRVCPRKNVRPKVTLEVEWQSRDIYLGLPSLAW